MADLSKRPAVVPTLVYKDSMAAFEWLQTAFGFQPAMLITDADGKLAHSELTFGDGWIMVGNEWSANHASPATLNGRNTQSVHLQLTTDIDAHCAHARQSGAYILAEPETQFYGDRTYRAQDPEGHIWTFGQTVKSLTPEQWDQDTGLKTKMWP